MICEKCDKQIDDDAKFCSFCGYKIEKKSEEVEIYTNSKLKGIVFRIIAIILAYFGFVAVKVALVPKSPIYGEFEAIVPIIVRCFVRAISKAFFVL